MLNVLAIPWEGGMILFLISLLASGQLMWADVPKPLDDDHPGSEQNLIGYQRVVENFLRRQSVAYIPDRPDGQPAPVVVFGHGQALGENAYDATLKHLAQKGVAALFVKYDNGFFDQNWRRMASDYNEITQSFLQKYSDQLDSTKVVFAGHSKGAYVGLMAAGAPNRANVSSLVLFAPAGFDAEYLQNIPQSTPVTIIWGQSDTVIHQPDQMEIYQRLSTDKKQLITVNDYPNQRADHYFIQNRRFVFGGQDGVSPFHYHGVWKWLVGAAWDLEAGGLSTSPYIYGDEAITTGLDQLSHQVMRNWEPVYDYIIKVDHSVDSSSLLQLLGAHQLIRKQWYQVWLTQKQLNELSRDSRVLSLSPNHTFKALTPPNDFLSSMWHFDQPSGFDLNALKAWELARDASHIRVAVVDSGIRRSHPDLRDNVWVNQIEAQGQPQVDDDNNGYVDDIYGFNFAANQPNSDDNRGHGTQVSGALGAIGNNGIGTVGMAWHVSMMPLNMFPNLWGNATLASAVRAIDYAIDNKAHIINASWGQATQADVTKDPGFQLLYDTIERANQEGILFVAAAGNDGSNNDMSHMVPATLGNSNILSVGATARNGLSWNKSNYGAHAVHVMAPGQEILTTSHNGGVRYSSGTSLSAPLVSGLAALMLSANPDLSPQDIIQILERSCDPHPGLLEHSRCNGYLNAATALERAMKRSPAL
jgi:subtilisin family serine protease/predicted esterase